MGSNVESIIGYLSGSTQKEKSSGSSPFDKRIRRFEELWHQDRNWRDRKVQWENFYDGYQWSDEELESLRKRAQPDVVINRIKTAVDVVVGLQQNTRTRIKPFPRDIDVDQAIADAMAEAVRFVEQNNEISFIESDVFEEGVKSGRGWFYFYVELDEMNQPEIKIEWIPNDDILFDRSSIRHDLKDAKDLIHTVWIDPDDLIAKFPKKKKLIEESVDQFDFQPQSFSVDYSWSGDDYQRKRQMRNSSNLWFDKQRKQLRVVNHWYRVNEKRKVIVHPDLGFHVLDKKITDEQANNILDVIRSEMGLEPEVHDKYVRLARVCTYTGKTKLDDKESDFQNESFPYVPFFAFRESKTGDHYGLIKQAIDPQKEYNKRRSKALHILNSKQVIMDIGAVDSVDELREEIARPDGVIVKNAGRTIEIRDDKSLGNSQLEMAALAGKEVDDVTGVSRELLGQQTNIRSAKGIDRKLGQGMMVLARLFSNWKRSRLQASKMMVMFIQEYWTPERAIRVMNDQQVVSFMKFGTVLDTEAGQIPFNEFASRKFDMIFDAAEDSLNLQEEAFYELAKLAQTGALPAQVLMEFAPVPFEVKQRIIAQLQGLQSPSPEGAPGAEGGVTESGVNPELTG